MKLVIKQFKQVVGVSLVCLFTATVAQASDIGSPDDERE